MIARILNWFLIDTKDDQDTEIEILAGFRQMRARLDEINVIALNYATREDQA